MLELPPISVFMGENDGFEFDLKVGPIVLDRGVVNHLPVRSCERASGYRAILHRYSQDLLLICLTKYR